MIGRILAAAVLALGLAGPPSSAATLGGYTSFHVLGDSLSDTGNVHALTFGLLPPSPPYWRGRFSNGPVWADHLEDDFRAHDLPTSNFAFGGAEALGLTNPVPPVPVQLSALQLYQANQRVFGDRPLVAIWAGANDLFVSIGRRDARRTGRRAAEAIGSTTRALSRFGVEDFLVLNLPDLGETPRYRGGDNAAAATAGTIAFNDQLAREMQRLRSRGVAVTEIDTFAWFDALRADPEAYGLSDVEAPCLRGLSLCPPEVAARLAIFDDVHPSAAIHALIADVVREELGLGVERAPAAVPLPAPALLLLVGVAALGACGLRRRMPPDLTPAMPSQRLGIA